MNKKIKKKLKKKDQGRSPNNLIDQPEIKALKQKIQKLEKELSKRKRLIEELYGQLKKDKTGKGKKSKSAKNVPNPLFKGQTKRVGVVQKQAWRRHGYLRDRYEFHLGEGQGKSNARVLADKDLRDRYGEDAGYTELELEQILT
ncbi:MAG: hypothetical protein ABFS39_04180 [Pseudomonadota bacterium]